MACIFCCSNSCWFLHSRRLTDVVDVRRQLSVPTAEYNMADTTLTRAAALAIPPVIFPQIEVFFLPAPRQYLRQRPANIQAPNGARRTVRARRESRPPP